MMSDGDNDGQMIFGDLGGLKLPDIYLTGEEEPQKNLTQETCPDRGSNPGPLRDGSYILIVLDWKCVWESPLLQGGREINSILLTVVGDGWKDQKIYIQYGV